jgi:hypothetical protein
VGVQVSPLAPSFSSSFDILSLFDHPAIVITSLSVFVSV